MLSSRPANPRLAVLPDFPEEGWPSMDLCADMLLRHLRRDDLGLSAVRVCPPFRRRLGAVPWLGGRGAARNADRLYNRHWHYPRFVRRHAGAFDAFHVVDHSYAQVVTALPADRTGVLCHDLDTFRCLLDAKAEPRPRWFRAMARRSLEGLTRTAVVFYTTEPVRWQILRHGLIDDHRLVKVPLGISPEFVPAAPRHDPADALLTQRLGDAPYLLHVGTTIARKRVDVLLDVFAEVRRERPDLMLLQNGGEWTPEQRRQIERRSIGTAVVQIRGTSRDVLAGLYRRAAAVLQPSDAEGFGLPVAEAMACGAVVLASDIPVLREVGGEGATYCPAGNVGWWAQAVGEVLADPSLAPPRRERLAAAARYTWSARARVIAQTYRRLLTTPTLTLAGRS